MGVVDDLKATFELKFDKKIMGIIYSLTNEKENKVEIIGQFEDGSVKSLKTIATGGEGSDSYSSFKDAASSDPQLSAYGIITSKNGKLLFAINGGDNSVSSFKIQHDGDLKFVDNQKTNNSVPKTINSLAYNEQLDMLYVGHSAGEHIHTFKVSDGKMTKDGMPLSVSIYEFPNRYCPSILLSPDNKFLLAHVLVNDDPKEVGPKPADMENLVVIAIDKNGLIEADKFDTISVGNFSSYFIDKDKFVMVSALNNQISLVKLLKNGDVELLDSVTVSALEDKMPAETCWVTYHKKTSTIYAANFGYGTITSVRLNGDKLELLNDMEVFEKGGTEVGIAGINTTAPVDILELNGFIYEIFGNTGELKAYKVDGDSSLIEVDSLDVVKQAQFGLAGINHQ